jgi:uncharacterized protein
MPLSLYEITIPVFIKNLKVLSSLLDKGLAHVHGNEASLAESRLIADMHPLTYQIQRVSDTAKGVAVRVGKAEPVVMEDNEKTFADMQDRISRTIEFLEKLDPACMDGAEDSEIVLKIGPIERRSKARDYVLGFAIPNFYFHLCMAYALLRKEGVPIGKADYMGRN